MSDWQPILGCDLVDVLDVMWDENTIKEVISSHPIWAYRQSTWSRIGQPILACDLDEVLDVMWDENTIKEVISSHSIWVSRLSP